MGSVKSFCVRVGEPGTACVGLCGTKSVLAGGGFVRTPAPKHTGLSYFTLQKFGHGILQSADNATCESRRACHSQTVKLGRDFLPPGWFCC